jgi:hypothetical protein
LASTSSARFGIGGVGGVAFVDGGGGGANSGRAEFVGAVGFAGVTGRIVGRCADVGVCEPEDCVFGGVVVFAPEFGVVVDRCGTNVRRDDGPGRTATSIGSSAGRMSFAGGAAESMLGAISAVVNTAQSARVENCFVTISHPFERSKPAVTGSS